MKLKEYKRQWLLDQIQVQRDKGLRDAAIARRMGIKPPWFSEAIKKDQFSDDFVDRFCSAFGVRFTTGPTKDEATTERNPQNDDGIGRLERSANSQAQLTGEVLTQILELRRQMERIEEKLNMRK